MEINDATLAAYHAVLSESVVYTHELDLDTAPGPFLDRVELIRRTLVEKAETLTLEDEEQLGTLCELFQESVRLSASSFSSN